MEDLFGLRTLLVTGKGGVGKTTVTAALARAFSRAGKRVLCAEVSMEGATESPLSLALGVEPLSGEEPLEVADRLFAMTLSAAVGHKRFLRDVLPVRWLANAALKSAAVRRFLTAAPTFPEMGVLYHLTTLSRAAHPDGGPAYDLIMVDLPATGHALALVQVPEAILRVMEQGPIATAVREGLTMLTDPARTAAVVVTIPEALPVSEATELTAALRGHNISVARVVVNRVPYDPFSIEERAELRRLLVGRPPTLGERSLERIDRARVALERLGMLDVPTALLFDTWSQGQKLSEEMASYFAVEGVQ